LHIDPTGQENAERMDTAFTVTVDAKEGASAGSRALDRVVSIRKLADPEGRHRRRRQASRHLRAPGYRG
jgi:3,4-dihydroxy-2-butanone 4-phosphate synthase